LLHPERKNITTGINQQNQVMPFKKLVPQLPVNFPAQTPGMVPFHRFSEFTRKRKGDTVIWQPIPER